MEHFTKGLPVIDGVLAPSGPREEYDAADEEIVVQIKELLETRVRPAVAQDGGDIVYRGLEDGVVLLKLIGSCSTCPSSTATLALGVERMLLEEVPEVRGVRQVD
jgi:Fe-S cluster biogenesis protein NfuA